jgi:hypothetical protein
MDDDMFPILLIVLLGGAAVWYILNRKPATPVAVPPPCTVGYQGVSVSCAAIGQGVKVLENVAGGASQIISHLPLIGTGSSGPTSLADRVKRANAAGYQLGKDGNPLGQTGTGWQGVDPGKLVKLPAGYVNAIDPKTGWVILAPTSQVDASNMLIPPVINNSLPMRTIR